MNERVYSKLKVYTVKPHGGGCCSFICKYCLGMPSFTTSERRAEWYWANGIYFACPHGHGNLSNVTSQGIQGHPVWVECLMTNGTVEPAWTPPTQ